MAFKKNIFDINNNIKMPLIHHLLKLTRFNTDPIPTTRQRHVDTGGAPKSSSNSLGWRQGVQLNPLGQNIMFT